MASPQKENGYTPIANELLEKIYGAVFTIAELKILLAVMRCTYGYSRRTHRMSGNFLAHATGLNVKVAGRVLTGLIRKNVILVAAPHDRTEIREIGIQKDYEAWKLKLSTRKGYAPAGIKATGGWEGYPPPGGKEIGTQQYHKVTKIKTNNKTSVQPFSFQDSFNRFWETYPRRQAKQEAMKAFGNLNPDEALLTVIIAAVKRKAISEEWLKNRGQFIPLPASYLNGRRWEDEMTVLPAGWEPGLKYINDNWKGKLP